MGCPTCMKTGRGIMTNQPRGLFSSFSDRLTSFSDDDFMVVYYTGDKDIVIGKVTQINYGEKLNGQQMIVHKLDFLPGRTFSIYPIDENLFNEISEETDEDNLISDNLVEFQITFEEAAKPRGKKRGKKDETIS